MHNACKRAVLRAMSNCFEHVHVRCDAIAGRCKGARANAEWMFENGPIEHEDQGTHLR